MANTRPVGPKTGRATPGCYAASLLDCAGPTNREHYVSKVLLKKFGTKFWTEGLPWLEAPKQLGESAFTSRVLCKRHNEALSPLDATIGKFFDVIRQAANGEDVGTRVFQGEDLERWALKVLIGTTTSANVVGADGQKDVLETVPDQHLRILFGEAEMPTGCGFYYVGDAVADIHADLLNVALMRYPDGDPYAGMIFGVLIKLLGFQFVTTVVTQLTVVKQRVWHRPCAFKVGDRCIIGLRWLSTDADPNLALVLRTPSSSAS